MFRSRRCVRTGLTQRQEALTAEFERKRKEAEETAEAKTAKNRAKRQKKKGRAKQKSEETNKSEGALGGSETSDLPFKKRRLVNGKELVFRKPGEESCDESDDGLHPLSEEQDPQAPPESLTPLPLAQEAKITIHEDD